MEPDGQDNLDKEVTMLDPSIHSFMQEMQDMGLDPPNLDGSAGALLPPMLDLDQQQQQHSLHPLATQLPAHLPQTQTQTQTEPQPSTSSSLPSPSPSTSTDPFSVLQVPPHPLAMTCDMYRFLDVDGPKDDDGVKVGCRWLVPLNGICGRRIGAAGAGEEGVGSACQFQEIRRWEEEEVGRRAGRGYCSPCTRTRTSTEWAAA
jgi:hypothetical protein